MLGEAAWIAKVLPVVFLILLVVALVMGRKGLSRPMSRATGFGTDESST